MHLTPQDLWDLRNALIRAVNDCHEILAGAARRAKAERALGEPSKVRAEPAQHSPPVEPTPPTKPKLTYGISEAGELLSLGRSTLYKAIGAGELNVVRVGGRTLIKASELEAFISKCAEKGGRRQGGGRASRRNRD